MMSGKRARGFTLLELMIAVGIIGIIAATAYPSYVENVRAARRADAAEVLMRIAQAQERHFTLFSSYASALTGGVSLTNLGLVTATSESGDSVVSISGAGVNTYLLTATITPADPTCGNLTLNQLGVKTPANPNCW